MTRFFRSTDQGRTWTVRAEGRGGLTWKRLAAESTLIAVDPRTPQTLYMVKRNGRLLRSVFGNLIRDPRRPVLYTGGGGLFEINVP